MKVVYAANSPSETFMRSFHEHITFLSIRRGEKQKKRFCSHFLSLTLFSFSRLFRASLDREIFNDAWERASHRHQQADSSHDASSDAFSPSISLLLFSSLSRILSHCRWQSVKQKFLFLFVIQVTSLLPPPWDDRVTCDCAKQLDQHANWTNFNFVFKQSSLLFSTICSQDVVRKIPKQSIRRPSEMRNCSDRKQNRDISRPWSWDCSCCSRLQCHLARRSVTLIKTRKLCLICKIITLM